MTRGALQIVKPGLLSTVQDLGRWGHQASGVPVAGPMDVFSHRLANQLVGNEPAAATLEITLIGPEMTVEADTMLAVAGAEFDLFCDDRLRPIDASFSVQSGQRLRFGRRRIGARAYLAVAAGIQTAPVLGSRATHVLSRMGGLDGRPIAAGDRLPVAAAPALGVPRRSRGLALPTAGRARLRVLLGPQADWLTDAARQALTSASFRLSPRSNRMGYRLEGPRLAWARDAEPISEPLPMGAIQVPAAGDPILLMADRQTAGGYPKIATVISADLPLAGQLAPGDSIDFVVCTRREAVAALIASEQQLMRSAG